MTEQAGPIDADLGTEIDEATSSAAPESVSVSTPTESMESAPTITPPTSAAPVEAPPAGEGVTVEAGGPQPTPAAPVPTQPTPAAPVPTQPTPAAPVPTPAPPKPTPPPVPHAPPVAAPAPVAPEPASATEAPSTSHPFGRVEADGSVYVSTTSGERLVGQIPDVPASEALEFYTKRFDALAVNVELLEQRLQSGTVRPDEAAGQIKKERKAIQEANAVGDLDGLLARLDALVPLLNEMREARRAEKAEQTAQAKQAKEKFVAQAEKLAAGTDWRHGVNRFRELLEQWKTLPRLDKTSDDELWHRFSSARSSYTRRRKAHMAEQTSQREQAAAAKRAIIAQAEQLADSTDWGPTSGEFRTLMQKWKAAGAAPRDLDDKLWAEFRGLQDRFFEARNAAQTEQDQEFLANQQAKEALLAEYEAQFKPAEDLAAARAVYRELAEKWAEVGKVPRDAIRGLDQRMRAFDTAIKKVEEEQWRRTNPEAKARAEDTASKLRDQIESYEAKATKAEAKGDAKAAAEARKAADTYRTWLASAEAAASDFSG